MSPIKCIYSSAFDAAFDVGMRVVDDPAVITKQASTIFNCDYSEIQPDKDHVGIHLVALGAYERYGANRNFDAWTKAACEKYHDTFVKHGHVYRHHRNKDPRKSLGCIKASAYNPEMDRVELFIHANKEKAADEIQRLEKEGEIPFSMACKVAYDRCSICGKHRKNSRDPEQCEHIATKFGEMMDDGRLVFTFNDEPQFFDISFVGRPADRIAWNLKVASARDRVDSVKLAEAEGIWVPDHLALESASSMRKLELLRKIAAFEDQYRKMNELGVQSVRDRYVWELRKAATATLDDSMINELRRYEPADVFKTLAASGVVLDAESFFKYAFGINYGDVSEHMPATLECVQHIFTDLVKSGQCQLACNDVMFDTDVESAYSAASRRLGETVKRASVVGYDRDERIIYSTIANEPIKMVVDFSAGKSSNTKHEAQVLATKYAAYKLSAVEAIVGAHRDTDVDSVCAISAAQNLIVK